MPLILGANSVSGYNVANSLRFNSGSSDYLNRTFATNGTDRKIRTISCWVKRAKLGAEQVIIGADDGSANQARLVFLSGDTLNCRLGGASAGDNTTTAVFRDVSAWYHIVASIDTTQATAANRVKIYVNGVQQTVPSPSSTQNQTTFIYGGASNVIGQVASLGATYFDGYMSEFYFIDGQALTPSSFGETDTDTGIWKPKKYTGTFGTNGFYLEFKNSASLGTDSSPYNMLTAQTNGTTNGIQRGANLTGIANGKTGTVSMWCNFTASSSGTQILWSSRDNTTLGTTFRTARTSSGNFQSLALNSAGTTIMSVVTSSTPLSSAGFYHIYFSWDLAVTNKAYLYINGSSVALTYTTFTNDTIQYSVPNHGLAGNLLSPFSPTTPAMFGQVYVNYSTYLDPVTNINKFYGGTSTPVSIGSSGEIPSGSSPIVYLDGDDTGILVNRGTGGNFSAFGTLATGTTYSGTGNNINTFTVNNLTSIDQTTDTPTNNFATLNPLDKQSGTASAVISEGNTVIDYGTSTAVSGTIWGTIGVNTGKWYAEFNLSSYSGSSTLRCGFVKFTSTSGATKDVSATGIFMVALDLTNSLYWVGTNGVWDAGDPSTGTGGTSLTPSEDFYTITVRDNSGTAGNGGTWKINAGNPAFTIVSGNADGAGYGNFEYAVPSGYYALCTKNLAQFG